MVGGGGDKEMSDIRRWKQEKRYFRYFICTSCNMSLIDDE